jgi:hypothetical protein
VAEGDGATNVDSANQSASPAEGSSASDDPLDVATGDTVMTIEDLVNLRSDASSSDDNIVKELPMGTELEITGDPIEANGYRWYPVKVVESGETGYIVQDFIEPA